MKTIGAWAEVEWLPEGDRIPAYFSFGQFDEDKDCDSFGIPDNEIFYYCDMDEYELQKMMNNKSDFRVLSYELVTRGDL